MKRLERKVRRGNAQIAMQHEDKDPQKITGDGPEGIVDLLNFTIAEVDRALVQPLSRTRDLVLVRFTA